MSNESKLNAHQLMNQASTTSQTYMLDAIKYIDETFGEGYAVKNPSLVGDFMKTAALDFLAAAHVVLKD
jgi:hypothetical protein